MRPIWLYAWMARARWLDYRGKVMAMAFLGTHIPLIALAVGYAARGAATWAEVAWALGLTLAATLCGTALTLFVLDQLLRPVAGTALALRRYREGRVRPDLPTGFTDEVGTLMADAQRTVEELDDSLRRLERYDQPTGLLNRAAFAAEAGDRPVAVLRLPGFGAMAGSLDREAATEALRQVAHRLCRRLGAGTRLARVGDADLAFRLPPGLEEGEGLRALLSDLSAPLDVGGRPVTPRLLIGTAEGEGEAALDAATAALSAATDDRPVAAHSPALRDRLRDRFHLEEDLRAALRDGEFRLAFQPVRDHARGAWVGAEALLRWPHPTRGLVPPSTFVPVAEASGLIGPIGLWVLREAAREAASWGRACAWPSTSRPASSSTTTSTGTWPRRPRRRASPPTASRSS